ncbi:MAG: acyl--CoA ligase [Acidimicrobiia bacterium]|nr:acyl--CoA ligase [Acidimicrobiia bacterium]
MVTREEVEAQLTAPGAMFEITGAEVFGAPVDVFVQRPPHLRALLERSADFGDAEYLVFDTGVRLTFERHLRAVADVADALARDYGVGRGDRVAILAANCPEWILAFWAAVSLGAVAVGMNAWWAGDEIRYGIDDAEPTVLVADAARLARLGGADPGVAVIEIESGFGALWETERGAALPAVAIDEDDPLCILYTSGTTGRPKGVVNTHRNVLGLMALQMFVGIRGMMMHPPAPEVAAAMPPQRCQLVGNPLFHVSGVYTHVVTMLGTGTKTVWTTGRFEPEKIMQLIEAEKVTGWSPMGSMAARVVNHPDVGRYDLSTVLTCGSGGAPMPTEVQRRLREVFPNAKKVVAVGYGQTECAGLATLNFGDGLEDHPDSVGWALPTIDVSIRDPFGEPVADGTEGEIWLRGPVVMKEYWRRPDDTAEVLTPERWLRTGDIGHVRDGMLYVNARARDMIIRAAENVYPVEIEMRLEEHPAVSEAAVVGVDHPELGQEVKAIVVLETGVDVGGDIEAELTAWVSERLAYYKVPAHWDVRGEALPRNAAGKVMKNVLVGAADNPFVDDAT